MLASGLLSSWVTESMKESCRRTSRISRTRKTVNSTSTVMMATNETTPATISQVFCTTSFVTARLRISTRIHATSMKIERPTAVEDSTIGRETDRRGLDMALI